MKMKVVGDAEERRDGSRQPSYKILPLSIVKKECNRRVSAQLVDVSRDGLGVITHEKLEAGVLLTLQMLKNVITFEVAWCKDHEGGDFFCGLLVKEGDQNLEKLFHALLTENQAS